ncbi:MAG TPA: hypothetical protein VFP65_29415 [Anaeromyxobacteraceae bacterium]|nr:hypothetical protein [Anaeromyxobacteraceae bacterium]
MSVRRWACVVAALAAVAAACAAPEAQRPAETPYVWDPLVPPATDRERLARGDAELARLRADASAVLAGLDEARAERDVVRLACLDERAEAARVLLRSGEGASESLAGAIARADVAADAELARLGALRLRARELRTEAEACMGRATYEADGKTAVRATGPEGKK